MLSITSTGGSRLAQTFLGLAAGIAAIALPAAAQVQLAITEADNGSMQVAAQPGNNVNPVALNCSLSSPQFSNNTTYQGSSSCIQTSTIWVVNKSGPPTNAVPTATTGTVTVKVDLSPVQPKGSTVLAVNGLCNAAFSGGCGNISGNPASGGWTCSMSQGSVTCFRSDSLAAGATFPPIVIKFVREDFSPPSTWNDVVTVTGGGGPDVQLQGNPLAWNIMQQVTFPTDGRYVTIHSVPEGLLVGVDGALVMTPHTDYWQAGSTHSVDGDAGNNVPWGLPFGQAGSTFPNSPWLLNNTAPVIASITGTIKNNVLWTTLPPNVVTGTTNYEAITFLYHK